MPLLAVFGCGLAVPERGRVLTSDQDLAPVATATFERRVRHTDILRIEVVFPSDPDGAPRRPVLRQRWPAVVFLQGGRVPEARYRWLALALAQRGYVVALPAHALDLPIAEVDNASVARDLLAFPPADSLLDNLVNREQIAVAGHALGGAVAVKSTLTGGYAAVALLASHPDPDDGLRFSRTGFPTLLLAGGEDCQSPREEIVEKATGAVPGKNVVAVLAGVSHHQFTDSDREDSDDECAPAIPLEEAHARIVEVMDVFLRHGLADIGETGELALASIEGVEVARLQGAGE